ncbi:MAG: hypothetical protein JWP52_4421, partial [Rhizobacter sp.]|nr:hypothetical protein [Rhizobacter sp.]
QRTLSGLRVFGQKDLYGSGLFVPAGRPDGAQMNWAPQITIDGKALQDAEEGDFERVRTLLRLALKPETPAVPSFPLVPSEFVPQRSPSLSPPADSGIYENVPGGHDSSASKTLSGTNFAPQFPREPSQAGAMLNAPLGSTLMSKTPVTGELSSLLPNAGRRANSPPPVNATPSLDSYSKVRRVDTSQKNWLDNLSAQINQRMEKSPSPGPKPQPTSMSKSKLTVDSPENRKMQLELARHFQEFAEKLDYIYSVPSEFRRWSDGTFTSADDGASWYYKKKDFESQSSRKGVEAFLPPSYKFPKSCHADSVEKLLDTAFVNGRRLRDTSPADRGNADFCTLFLTSGLNRDWDATEIRKRNAEFPPLGGVRPPELQILDARARSALGVLNAHMQPTNYFETKTHMVRKDAASDIHITSKAAVANSPDYIKIHGYHSAGRDHKFVVDGRVFDACTPAIQQQACDVLTRLALSLHNVDKESVHMKDLLAQTQSAYL